MVNSRSTADPFPLVLDPEYAKLKPGKIWRKAIFVCAACLGTGKRSDALARSLSGEFHPAAGMRPLTVK